MKSWFSIPDQSDFSIHNLPYGVFQAVGKKPVTGIAVGEHILDLQAALECGIFDSFSLPKDIFSKPVLNDFIALGKEVTVPFRKAIQQMLCDEKSALSVHRDDCFLLQKDVKMLLPIHIPNYTDFYSSREHATNVGIMFRDPANALLPNWLHLPVGYHGRASSIVVSGTDITRPKGQTKADTDISPSFGPSRLLDFELEMAFVVGKKTTLGNSVNTSKAEDHIFGLMLFNDWSARDIQKWEYVPLGPFLAKNFASTVSPWIVPLEALEPFRVASPIQEPEVLPYLKCSGEKNYDIQLEVSFQTNSGEEKVISQSNFKFMYWNMCQQLAHHTVNGCNIEVGDLYASGTISGPTPGSYGSLLEITWQGKNPIHFENGIERKFLQDFDTIKIKGAGFKDGIKVGFGECIGKILPSN